MVNPLELASNMSPGAEGEGKKDEFLKTIEAVKGLFGENEVIPVSEVAKRLERLRQDPPQALVSLFSSRPDEIQLRRTVRNIFDGACRKKLIELTSMRGRDEYDLLYFNTKQIPQFVIVTTYWLQMGSEKWKPWDQIERACRQNFSEFFTEPVKDSEDPDLSIINAAGLSITIRGLSEEIQGKQMDTIDPRLSSSYGITEDLIKRLTRFFDVPKNEYGETDVNNLTLLSMLKELGRKFREPDIAPRNFNLGELLAYLEKRE